MPRRFDLHPAVVFSFLFVSGCASAPAPAGLSTTPAGATTAGADAGPGVFPGAGTPSALPSDISFVSLEGPYWVAGGGYLLFSDVVEANGAGAHIYKYDPRARGFTVVAYPTTPPGALASTNGLGADAAGALLACERYNGRLVRLDGTPTSTLTVLAERWPPGPDGKAFNAPNDLVVRSDGNIYFTDSDWGARPGVPHPPMGVYRLSPRRELQRVLDIEKPNGIALSPDGGTLYVGSDVQAKVWKFPVDATGALGTQTLLIDGARVPGGFKVPDGICIDDGGNLYVTNNADDVKAIVVFAPTGRPLGRIPFPVAPSNCTFGGADRKTMYVTTLHAVYEVRMTVAGLP